MLQLIKGLEAARGNGTSMISLIMPPKDQVGAGPLRSYMCVSIGLSDGLWLHRPAITMHASVQQVRGQVIDSTRGSHRHMRVDNYCLWPW